MPREKNPACYDQQLKPTFHDTEHQRYVNATSGKCKRLRIQSTKPNQARNEVAVSDHTRKSLKFATWLVRHSPVSSATGLIHWIWHWYLFVVSLLQPYGGDTTYTGYYKSYAMEYWGQLWESRSDREYSTRKANTQALQVEFPRNDDHNFQADADSFPRMLIIYDESREEWVPCTDKHVLFGMNYIAVSYCSRDFPDKLDLDRKVRSACHEFNIRAYWVDFACAGHSRAEMNQDLYCLADVYRGATKTVLTIPDILATRSSDDRVSVAPSDIPPADALFSGSPPSGFPPAIVSTLDIPPQTQRILAGSLSYGWRSWGDRIWALQEVLLSRNLIHQVGSGPVASISHRQVVNLAFGERSDEAALIKNSPGKGALRLKRLSLLKKAIWKRPRTSSDKAQSLEVQLERPKSLINGKAVFSAYSAERVYALMGFFEYRIMPHPDESEEQEFARLCLANDSERIAERMAAMLPERIPDTACWYADNDSFGANLWDIEPDVQAAGVIKSGSLVLDGCRAASIRWKNFPQIGFAIKPSLKRRICGILPYVAWFFLIAGIAVIVFSIPAGIASIVAGVFFLLISPHALVYSTSGLITAVQPWLIGVKGVMTAKDISDRLYGGDLDPRVFRITYSSTGSVLAHPKKDHVRRGDADQSEWRALHEEQQLQDGTGGDVYTLVDTLSNTVYYFTAHKPPTVCVYVGREGGLGRFILCSETCSLNELHKEAVLRMPTYIVRSMRSCGWLAIGRTPSNKQRSPFGVSAEAYAGPLNEDKSRSKKAAAITARPVASVFALAAGLGWLPKAEAAQTGPLLRQFHVSNSLDPVSLITLFFDTPEKDLLDKKGDMTLASCFGLFVNPSTAWNEYKALQPGQGLVYYNPMKKIVSSVEVQQVNNYLIALAGGYKDCGVVVKLTPLQGSRWWPTSLSWEWLVLRPLVLLALIIVVALSLDFVGAGAICALLLGQTIAIVKSVYDSKVPDTIHGTDEQANVFFISNNVTVIVKCQGDLFRQVSSYIISKPREPFALRSITTLIFLSGVLLVGFTGTDFKIAYLAAHAIQALLLAFANERPLRSETVNRATWEVDVDSVVPLQRRREAYVWASKQAGTGTEWLTAWNLAAGETLDFVEKGLAEPALAGPSLEEGNITLWRSSSAPEKIYLRDDLVRTKTM